MILETGGEPIKRSIGIFDISSRCPLRCNHCYYYTNIQEIPTELPDAIYLKKLKLVRDRYEIQSAFWVGGEPLLKLNLLREAIKLFPRNAIATSGILPIPEDLNASILISIDGSKAIHDSIRGKGLYAKTMKQIKKMPPKSFAIFTVLTSESIKQIEALPDLMDRTQAQGILVGFQVSGTNGSSQLKAESREMAVNLLLQLKIKTPEVLLNTEKSLELFRPSRQRAVEMNCIYKSSAISFDVRFKIKEPCTFEGNADCSSCGCPLVMIQEAKRRGDKESDILLHALFPNRINSMS
ncbi:MAG: hypothetical protein IIB39_11065 [Candidatus Marinimicrobia bacterium]|nr:hypothetical protein [Candidatus Neomarinimicrobiota bacterium]